MFKHHMKVLLKKNDMSKERNCINQQRIQQLQRGHPMKRATVTWIILLSLTCPFSHAISTDDNCLKNNNELTEVTPVDSDELFISYVNFINSELINMMAVIEQPEHIQTINPNFHLTYCIEGLYYFLYGLFTFDLNSLLNGIVAIMSYCTSGIPDDPGYCTWEWLYECQQNCHGNDYCESACWEECAY